MEHLTTIFQQLMSMSLTALPVMAVVLAIRWLLRSMPKKYTYLLWLVVAFRLVCPVTVESPLGFLRAEQTEQQVTAAAETYIEPTLTFRDNGGFTPDYEVLLNRGYTPNEQGEIVTNEAGTREAWQVKDLLPAAAVLWLTGAAAMLLWLVISTVRLKRQVSTAVRREGNVWECDGIPTPFVLGLLRPRIYIPFRMTEEERTYILAHERYHIRRGDHWAKALALLVLAVYWWNPAVWLCWTLFCRDMEMRCDEAVLAQLGDSVKKEYSLSLLSFALDRRAPMALAFGEHDAARRIKNVLRWKQAKPAAIFLSVTAVVLAALICGTNAVAKKDLVEFTNCDSGVGVDFTARIPESSLIAAIYQDIYRDGNFVSSRPVVSFGTERIPDSREISGCLRYDVPHGDDGFAGSVNFVFTDRTDHTDSTLPEPLEDASEEWTVTLPLDHYTGSGSCIGEDGKADSAALTAYSSIPLLTVVLSDEPNGKLTFYQQDADITALNACTIQFRLVTTPDGVLSSSAASGSTDETSSDDATVSGWTDISSKSETGLLLSCKVPTGADSVVLYEDLYRNGALVQSKLLTVYGNEVFAENREFSVSMNYHTREHIPGLAHTVCLSTYGEHERLQGVYETAAAETSNTGFAHHGVMFGPSGAGGRSELSVGDDTVLMTVLLSNQANGITGSDDSATAIRSNECAVQYRIRVQASNHHSGVADDDDPAADSSRAVSGILGFDGYLVVDEVRSEAAFAYAPWAQPGKKWRHWAYRIHTTGGSVPLAWGYGFGEPGSHDYSADLDGDGVKEMICQSESAEGFSSVTVYQRRANGIYQCWLSYYPSGDDADLAAISYDPASRTFLVTGRRGNGTDTVQMTIDGEQFLKYANTDQWYVLVGDTLYTYSSWLQQLCDARNDPQRILTLLGARHRLGNRFSLGQNFNHQLAIYYYDSPADPALRDTLLWKYSMVLLALLDNYTETTWNWFDNGVQAHEQNGGLWNTMDWLAQQGLDGVIRDYGTSPDKLELLLDTLFPTGIPNIGGDTVLNIPSLTEAAAMTEAELLGRIGGCVPADLQYAWGDPDGSLSGFWGDIWDLEGGSLRYVIVYYDRIGHADAVRLRVRDDSMSRVTASLWPSSAAATDLSAADAAALADLLDAGSWVSDVTNCAVDCVVTVDGQTLYYHSDCGTFNDTTSQRSLSLSPDDRETVNDILGRYVTLGTSKTPVLHNTVAAVGKTTAALSTPISDEDAAVLQEIFSDIRWDTRDAQTPDTNRAIVLGGRLIYYHTESGTAYAYDLSEQSYLSHTEPAGAGIVTLSAGDRETVNGILGKYIESDPTGETEPFRGILGYDGELEGTDTSGDWTHRTYYAESGGQRFAIAESFGWGSPCDHLLDLDGDGAEELVCCNYYGSGGPSEIRVYQRRSDGVWCGILDPDTLPGYTARGTESFWDSYDADTRLFSVWYHKEGGEPVLLSSTRYYEEGPDGLIRLELTAAEYLRHLEFFPYS